MTDDREQTLEPNSFAQMVGVLTITVTASRRKVASTSEYAPRVIEILRRGRRTAREIAGELGLAVAQTGRILEVMHRNGQIEMIMHRNKSRGALWQLSPDLV